MVLLSSIAAALVERQPTICFVTLVPVMITTGFIVQILHIHALAIPALLEYLKRPLNK